MTNTSDYKKIETWFRADYLARKYPDCRIDSGPIKLKWGGNFDYDALVYKRDGSLIAAYCLSCSEYKTTKGKGGSGKLQKIKGDVLMMLGTECPNLILAFTGKTMFKKVRSEQQGGRLPKEIQCELIELPDELSAIVQAVSAAAVSEVTPD